jgi:hypothetical protein
MSHIDLKSAVAGSPPAELESRNPKVLINDTALNDSDKTFAVPAGKIWEITSVFVDYVATAVVGNRQIAVDILDGSSNLLHQASAGVLITAGLARNLTFFASAPHEIAFINFGALVPLPPILCLPAGFQIRVRDTGIVDAAADDMTVRILGDERNLGASI